jgi:hypothetical protein
MPACTMHTKPVTTAEIHEKNILYYDYNLRFNFCEGNLTISSKLHKTILERPTYLISTIFVIWRMCSVELHSRTKQDRHCSDLYTLIITDLLCSPRVKVYIKDMTCSTCLSLNASSTHFLSCNTLICITFISHAY